MNKLIFFTGLSGSGKTTLSKELADELDYIHLDADQLRWRTRDSGKDIEIIDEYIDKHVSGKITYDNIEKISKLYTHFFNYLKENKSDQKIIVDSYFIIMVNKPRFFDGFKLIVLNSPPIRSFGRMMNREYETINDKLKYFKSNAQFYTKSVKEFEEFKNTHPNHIVINNKKDGVKAMSIINESFVTMISNPTPIARFEFNELLRESSYEDIIESSSTIMIYEPAVDMLKRLYESLVMHPNDMQSEVEKINTVQESIYSRPELVPLYNKLGECKSILENSITIRNSDEFLVETALMKFGVEVVSIKESIQNYVVTEAFQDNGPDETFLRTLESLVENQFGEQFVKLSKAQSDSEILAALESLMQLSTKHNEVRKDQVIYVEEAMKENVRKGAIKADEMSRKAYNKTRQGASEAKRVGTIAGKATGRFTNLVGDTIDKIREMDYSARREAIIRGGIQKKVIKLLRTAVTTGALSLISPIAAGINLIVTVALDKRTDKRVKDALITDLQNELRVVKEKVRDADNNGDKQAKYKLMRLESLLEKEIQRIESGNRNIEPMNYRQLRKENKK